MRWGPPDGAPIVLLHGVNQTGHSWDEVAQRFSDRFAVFAPDQRGHGESAWASDGDYGLQAMVGDLFELCAILGLCRFAWVGLSLGAAHAIAMAARRPEAVSHLAVVDFAPQIEQAGADKIRRIIELTWDSFEAAVEQIAAFNPRRTLQNIRDRLGHSLAQRADGRWGWRLDPALLRHPRFRDGANGANGANGTMGAWEDVPAVRCPTLVIRGEESDILSPELAEAMLAQLPSGRLVTVPGAGHSVAGDNPDEFCRSLRPFLAD